MMKVPAPRKRRLDKTSGAVVGDTRVRLSDVPLNMTAAARTCYESWVREAGYKDDARIPAWEKLKTFQQARWRTVAKDVIDAAAKPA